MQIETLSRWALVVIAAVALLGAFKYGQGIFAPLAFGLVLGVVLSPVADAVDRIGLPRALGALLSLVLGLGLIALVIVLIEPKVSQAMQRAPEIMRELRGLVQGLREIGAGIEGVSAEVAEAINEEAGNAAAAPAEEAEAVRVPSLYDALSFAPSFLAQVLIVIGAFFFFLLSRHEIYEWVARRRDGLSEGPTARTLKDAERQVARYFLAIALINGGFGLTVGLALHTLGLPAPYVWGLVAALMNFILYIGPALVAAGLVVAGALAFEGAMSLAPAAIFVGLNAIEGQFVTPALVGRHMRVNPLLVFLSLVLWLWLWGPIGGIVAIPILLYILAIVSGFGVSQTISFGTPGRSRPNRSAGVGS
jgi:predicted PurR-regulated permease PerM